MLGWRDHRGRGGRAKVAPSKESSSVAAAQGSLFQNTGGIGGSRAGEAQALVYLEPSRTLWKLPKNILLTSGRSKVTSCKAALGSWLK